MLPFDLTRCVLLLILMFLVLPFARVSLLLSVFALDLFFEPYLRFTPVDTTHTLVELDLVAQARGSNTLLYPQRRAEIDRFFVAIQDELDRRERWRPALPGDRPSIETGE